MANVSIVSIMLGVGPLRSLTPPPKLPSHPPQPTITRSTKPNLTLIHFVNECLESPGSGRDHIAALTFLLFIEFM